MGPSSCEESDGWASLQGNAVGGISHAVQGVESGR